MVGTHLRISRILEDSRFSPFGFQEKEIANEIHNDSIASNKDESVLINKTDSGLYFTNKFLKAKKRMQLKILWDFK